MTTIRKLVTFPELGARLLEEAAGPAGRRAAGDYLTAVLQQRRADWKQALRILEPVLSRTDLAATLGEFAGPCASLSEPILGSQGDLGSPLISLAMRVLLAEWHAGNVALRAALTGE